MKIKLSQIMNSIEVLQDFGNKKFPSKTSFRIQRNLRTIDPEIKMFEQERMKLIEKYKDEKNNISKESMETLNKELRELLEQELELDIMQLGIDELSFDISPNDLMRIEWMIDKDSI